MRIDIITIFPEMLEGFLHQSILKRAQEKELLKVVLHDLRNYSTNKHRKVDDYAYGGGAGMVMSPEPIGRCIDDLGSQRVYDEVIFLTPDGELFDQPMANELSLKKNLLMLCGRYKGVDQRIRDRYITREISIGDYVLTGGELPAAVVTDAITRLLPGVLGDESSALLDSFQGELLDAPVYTRPPQWQGLQVPEVLLSGHQARIDDWRDQQALEKTRQRRPELLRKENGGSKEKE